MKEYLKKILCLLLAFCLSTFSVAAQSVTKASSDVSVDLQKFSISDNKIKTFDFSLETEGLYLLRLEYRVVLGESETPKISVLFDNANTQKEDEAFSLTRIYSYIYNEKGEFLKDSFGNDKIPVQKEQDVWQTKVICPANTEGYYLTAGSHQVNIVWVAGNAEIRSISLVSVKNKSYSEYAAEHPKAKTNDYSYKQEAELLYQKSDLSISVTYDRSTPNVSPNSADVIKYNLLSGSSFSKNGQWVSWKFTAPEDGWYNFDFAYRQNIVSGMPVHRIVKINGEVLFDEMNDVVFEPSTTTKIKTIGNDESYAIYCEKGKEYVLSLEVTLKPIQEVIDIFSGVINDLNHLSNRINTVVGETVDIFRDYDLDKYIPELVETLRKSSENLERSMELLNNSDNEIGEYSARVNESIRVLNKMVDKPREIPENLEYFRSQILTLAGILGTLQTQPLELDYLVMRSTKAPVDAVNTHGFFSIVWFRFKNFINSFLQDYKSISVSDKDALEVWIGTNDSGVAGFATGRAHSQIINELVMDTFTSKTGVPVNISLIDVSGVLTSAIASGKGADAVLFTPKNIVSNLYYRDALLPLNEMKDFKAVKSRFTESSLIAFENQGLLYALPEVQTFQMMYYRTDIFEENGLSVPNTWEEFYEVVKQLQIKQMQVGMSESLLTYEMFLLQKGSALYNENLSKTMLKTQPAVEAFAQWTDLYNKYELPLSFEPMNRFRSGLMPLVINPISFYGQLILTAPEINGKWAMAPLPGTNRDGYIDRTQSSLTTGAIAVKHKNQKDYSTVLQFLDWWSSDDTQTQFAEASETRIGITSRYFPANKAAYESIGWSNAERSAISSQLESVWDVPQTPATFIIQRVMSNAFRRVVYDYENPRDVIYRYAQEIDNELTRKRAELGID